MNTAYQLIKSTLFIAAFCFFTIVSQAQCSSVGQIDSLGATVSPCIPGSNTATVTGGLSFSSLSAGGGGTLSVVLIMPSTGLTLTQTISPPYIIGGIYPFTFAGIPANGTGFTITASFLYPGPCGLSITLQAPASCVCTSDAGTFNQNVIGSTNSPGPQQYVLCYNDVLYISSNGDNLPPTDMTSSWGAGTPPVYSPGIWLMQFSCPPTVSSPLDILTDPCYIGIQSTANGYWQLSNWTGGQQTFYYVPVTIYSQANSIYAVNTNSGGYCYDLGPVHEVTYLDQIVGVSTPDCQSGTVSTNFTGGMPAFDGSNFTIVPGSLVPTTASFSNTSCVNGGDIEIFGLVNGDNYSYDVVDAQNCPITISGTFAGPAMSNFTYPQASYCMNEANPMPTLSATSTPGGAYSSAPAGLFLNATTGEIDLSFSTPGSYTVTYTTSNAICPTSTNFVVDVNPVPFVSISNQTACAGTAGTFTPATFPVSTYDYAWTVPLPLTNPGNVSPLVTSVAGAYSVIITDQTSNCSSAPSSATLTLDPMPVVQVSDMEFCLGGSTTLTAVTSQTGAITYNWTVPAGAPTPGNVPSFSTSVAGNYSVQITDASGCQSLPDVAMVTMNPLPDVTFNEPSFCTGTSTTIAATPTPAGTYSYVWTVPFGVVNPGNVSSFSINTGGVYTVQVTDVNTGCSSTVVDGFISELPLPTVVVNSPTICTGASAAITATPGTAATYAYNWTVPAGVAAPGNVSSFASGVAGNYSVQITDNTTGCISTISAGTLTINPLPTVQVSDETFCLGSMATLTATTAQAGTMTYNWTVPLGVPAPGSVASFTTNVVGNYSVQITDQNGCTSAADAANVSVNNGPTAVLNDSIICNGSSAILTASTTSTGTFNYTWTVPLGVINPGNVNTISTSTAGTYSVQITDVTAGCTGSIANGDVTVLALPTVVVNSPTVCVGTNAVLTATPGAAAIYTYNWTVPVGVPAPGNVSSFSSSVAGNYSVQITDASTGCVSAIGSGVLSTNPLPTVQVSDVEFCFGSNATLTAITPQAGLMTYNWNVPAGATAPGNVASFTTNVVGNYTVQLTDQNGCVSASATSIVSVDNGPTASLNDSTICIGANALLTASTASSGTFSYVWTVPAGAVNPGNVNSTSTNTAGTYTVQITDVNSSCTGSIATGNVTILTLPTVAVNSAAVCPGASATIIATPGTASTYSYAWTVPAGVLAPGNVSSFSSSVAGTYDVQITEVSSGCVSPSSSGTLTINPSPTVQVVDEEFCFGTNATLTAVTSQAGAVTYNWTVPAGATAPGNVSSFATNIIGTYFVQITDVFGCTSLPDSAIVTVDNGPTANLNDSIICMGANVQLTATSVVVGAFSYVWTAPAGVVNPGNVNSISTNTAGAYTVQITDVNSGCSGAIATGNVTVLPLPTVVVNTAPICAGGTATISATPGNTGAYTYDWAVPVGVPAPGNVSSFLSTIAGVYDVQITDDATGCVSPIASGTQVVNPNPTVSVNSATICDGATATITASPTNVGTYNYAWTVPLGAADPGNVANFTASMDGVYSVVITDNVTSCSSVSSSGTLTVLPNPIIDAGIDQVGCDTDNFTLTANGAGVGGNYVWTNGVADGVPFMPGAGLQTYTVTGTTIDGCVGTDDVDIFVDQTPVVSFNYVVDGQCAPVQVVFTNTSNPTGTNCTWTFDTGDVINNCGPVTYQFNDAGLFGVNLQVESLIAGCVANNYQANIINVEENPIADFEYSPGEITTLHNEVDFQNLSIGATNYSWNFGDNNGGSLLTHPTHAFSYTSAGTYVVTLIATTPAGCLDSASAVVEVSEEELFYIPNAFTPDNNEFNNVFQPVFTSGFDPQAYELVIFNRWGQVIFEAKNAELGWDGTFGADGKVCPDGVYTWKISYGKTETDDKNVLTGHVNLIR